MSWFEKLIPSRNVGNKEKSSVADGLWLKCNECHSTLYHADVEKRKYVCTKCGYHMRVSSRKRLETFLDEEGREELFSNIESKDPLKFRDSKRYTDRLTTARKSTGEKDALLVMEGRLLGMPIVACAFDFNFMGGSMGSVVGEKFVRAVNRAMAIKSPFVCFSSSGGARMQESMHSLTQMAKTSAVIKRLQKKQCPYVSVLANPTLGGVSASLSMLGDVIIAEPKAVIGFAGKRVIEQTVREKLPEGFQTSEFLLEHGSIDMIVPRNEMREKIHALISLLGSGRKST